MRVASASKGLLETRWAETPLRITEPLLAPRVLSSDHPNSTLKPEAPDNRALALALALALGLAGICAPSLHGTTPGEVGVRNAAEGGERPCHLPPCEAVRTARPHARPRD
jgi:hypothetical protein